MNDEKAGKKFILNIVNKLLNITEDYIRKVPNLGKNDANMIAKIIAINYAGNTVDQMSDKSDIKYLRKNSRDFILYLEAFFDDKISKRIKEVN
jgi:hypothetical protein